MNFVNKGLNPETRAGRLIDNCGDLFLTVDDIVNDNSTYNKMYSDMMDKARNLAWGNSLDGQSSARYFKEIKGYLND